MTKTANAEKEPFEVRRISRKLQTALSYFRKDKDMV